MQGSRLSAPRAHALAKKLTTVATSQQLLDIFDALGVRLAGIEADQAKCLATVDQIKDLLVQLSADIEQTRCHSLIQISDIEGELLRIKAELRTMRDLYDAAAPGLSPH